MAVFPKPLQKGDKIAVVSPAGAVDFPQISTTIDLIKSKGYEVELSPNSLGFYDMGYAYSGTEEERLSDLNWALNNDEISAIWATRGGYGCQHLLKGLELSQFKQNPKWYIGHSDNTVIQSFLFNHNFASIHGQTLKTSSFGVSSESFENIFQILEGILPKYQIKSYPLNKTGHPQGELIGGNLAMIYALLGSPYSFDFKDKILFIEDISEQFYALDRMLMGLELAGIFKQIKGIVIGGMNNMGNENNPRFEEDFDPLAYEIISHRLKNYPIPTVFAFPNGHIFNNLPLILGAKIKLEVFDDVKISFL